MTLYKFRIIIIIIIIIIYIDYGLETVKRLNSAASCCFCTQPKVREQPIGCTTFLSVTQIKAPLHLRYAACSAICVT